MEAPDAIKWLNELGVEFDKETDGTMITTHGGGTSRKRMHAAKDYSGSEIMRTIRDEVLNLGIPVVEFTSAVELLKDEKGQVAGAVLQNMETGDYMVARAKTVVIATGGAGRMHYQGFPTSNHYGATADGLVLGYRAGAALLYQDSIQYHPTGAVYPSQILGALVTEKVRSVGAQLVNAEGEAYIHPLETRDVNASGVIRECREGRGVEVPGGLKGVWLDTPMIEILGGEGTIEKRIPAMFRMYMNYGIDMRKVPIVIYPTLHYQNGGLEINGDGFTKEIPNIPAIVVSTILSDRICCRISFGRAPIARRIPISVVRSSTGTIMILDTPIAPASNVPNPTIQTNILMPLNKLSTIENIASAFRYITACLSLGAI